MKQISIFLIAAAVLYYILFMAFEVKTEVVVPEVQKAQEIKRPVREGNCWRQFLSDGTSVLVCG